MAQGQFYVMTTTCPANGAQGETTWKSDNLKAMGNICLRVSPLVKSQIAGKDTVFKMWDTLKETYSKPGVAAVFTEFKKAVDLHIPADKHPPPFIDKIIMCFTCIAAYSTKTEVPAFIQAMLIISKLPDRYSYVVQSSTQTGVNDINELTPGSICQLSMPGKAEASTTMSQGSSQGDGNGNGKDKHHCGKCGGKKNKQQDAHLTEECSHTMSPLFVTDPSAFDIRCPFFEPSPQPSDVFFTATKQAINLVRDVGLELTIERVRTFKDVVMSDQPEASTSLMGHINWTERYDDDSDVEHITNELTSLHD
ncbi:hypothetical protein K435DRAFT_856368 [Dendrothele bispora CBS 962.96]|uniref:Uncharacterized protein n=1 Tax=Dendrothele bispora (strain CBS 962.96) TaxID=1314807 RepID=A0A4S8M8N9_DENBC|nr:hypothetical protein K435DRAFT_856368 [Dendrothele bispora CBS 962.96]